jgi:ubiquinone/menaquinone biosynthesis C-methylase UbiE
LTQPIDEAAFVRAQYKSEHNLRARKAAYINAEGDDPREFAFAAVAEIAPGKVLEVGGGEGELAERIRDELGAEVIGIDQSERMVEIQQSKRIDARVGDVQELPFADGEFDVVVAAWMLYHVPDLQRGLAELARVLRAGGRLVAVTNAADHLRELWDLAHRASSVGKFTFNSENAEASLLRHFASVERRDAHGWTTMDEETIRGFAASWTDLGALVRAGPFEEPLRVQRHSTVFVAETA